MGWLLQEGFMVMEIWGKLNVALFRHGGVKHISGLIYEEFHASGVLKIFLEDVIFFTYSSS
jgi:hypothetical protein